LALGGHGGGGAENNGLLFQRVLTTQKRDFGPVIHVMLQVFESACPVFPRCLRGFAGAAARASDSEK